MADVCCCSANLVLMTNRMAQRVFFVSTLLRARRGPAVDRRACSGATSSTSWPTGARSARSLASRRCAPRRMGQDHARLPDAGRAGTRPPPARPHSRGAGSDQRGAARRRAGPPLARAEAWQLAGARGRDHARHNWRPRSPNRAACRGRMPTRWRSTPERHRPGSRPNWRCTTPCCRCATRTATLVLASEGDLDPVSAAALARKLKRPVSLRHRAEGPGHGGPAALASRRAAERRTPALETPRSRPAACGRGQAEALWQEYVSRQVLFAEVLMSLGHLDAAALSAVLLRHERSSMSLGEYMVGQGMISPAVLHEALDLQVRCRAR